jgi:hypothetical protein
MRIFKLIIISFIFLFAIITVISLFIPSNVQISKAVQINASKDSVMSQVSDPLNWKNWYPADKYAEFLHPNGKVRGIILDSSTRLTITEKKEDEVTAVYVLRSKDIKTGWKIIPASNSTAVEWYMNFRLRWYPWEKFSSLLFEKRYGPVMEQGLNNLKTYLENHSSNK